MLQKRNRQNAILKLVRQSRIDSQQQLADALAQQGFSVSQSTLSRDIQELGLAKAGSLYSVRQGAPRRNSDQTLRLVLPEFLLETDNVREMLVLKTASGSAATVAEALEGARWPGIVGTIAGEDTIFVLCRSLEMLEQVRERIGKLTGSDLRP